MIVIVDAVIWEKRPIRTRQAIALSGWCLISNEDGAGAAAILGLKTGQQFAVVTEGEVTFIN